MIYMLVIEYDADAGPLCSEQSQNGETIWNTCTVKDEKDAARNLDGLDGGSLTSPRKQCINQ